MAITCERKDCLHNWHGNTCALKNVTVGPDLTCQQYHMPRRVKLRKDAGVQWTSTQNEPFPFTTASHSFHEDWRKDK